MTDVRLSKNFWRSEFASNDANPRYSACDAELLDLLQILRDYYRRTITVTSGHRSPAHNKKVGGSAKSQHLVGKAADIQVSGISPKAVAKKVREWMPDHGGVGVYKTFIHIDVRDERADWEG